MGCVSVVLGVQPRSCSVPGDSDTCQAGWLVPQVPPLQGGLLLPSKGEVAMPARPCGPFPPALPPLPRAVAELGPGSLERKGLCPGALGGAGFDLLTIKMSAPLGSFLNQYLLFCG